MDPITIIYESRLRQEEILEATGVTRKHRHVAPITFGLRRWLRNSISRISQLRHTGSPAEMMTRRERPVHAGGRSK